jgi:hypothetical protein
VKKIGAAFTLGLIVVGSLAGCSGSDTANEKPCHDFEATFNQLNLQNKRNIMKYDDEFRAGLKVLSGVSNSGAQSASGDVKDNLKTVVVWSGTYEKSTQITYAAEAGGKIFDAVPLLAAACKAQGFPITLNPENGE